MFGFHFFSCKNDRNSLLIAGGIEDPKNEITKIIASLVTDNSECAIKLNNVISPSLDSLESNKYQLMIVGNNAKYREEVTVIAPLYPQILHILYKNDYEPKSFKDLLSGKKVYAGLPNSGSHIIIIIIIIIIKNLINDFQIDKNSIEFVDVLNLFKADVIIQFSDLIPLTSFNDLQDFKFYSIDNPENLGTGTVAEAICQRYPQYKPYVLSSMVYGEFLKESILTISNDAILVCRKDLDESLVFNIAQIIHENKQAFNKISPLLYYGISEDYNVNNLPFSLHSGARKYLERDMPSYFERNSNLIGVFLSIMVALVSGGFTVLNYRKTKKKDKIDTYYQRLLDIRIKIRDLDNKIEIKNELDYIKAMQNETIGLVIEEKLSANDSFLVYLKLSDIVLNEGKEALIEKKKTLINYFQT